jgi:hypothetical protein
MGIGQWMRVLDTVSGLVQMSGRFRRPADGDFPAAGGPAGGPLGQLETRLAGVVVAALKEAFDRDRARMDLERAHMDSERQRAEEALRAELRRQAAERSLGQLRLIATMAFALLMVSAALGVWMPGMRALAPRVLLGSGWMLSIGALGCAFAAWQHVATWTVLDRAGTPADPQHATNAIAQHPATTAAPWLLVGSLALALTALLVAL